MKNTSDTIIGRLFASFAELETAIESAKKTLEAKGDVPKNVIERLNSYDEILEKQRKLATHLCKHIKAGNWDEVTRLVTLINSLSSMIRDDARAILSSLALNSDFKEDDKIHFC